MTTLSMFNFTSDLNTNYEPGNEEPHSRSITVTAIEATILCVIMCVAVLGNILILTAIYRFSSLQTITNAFVANLAVADLLLTILGMTFTLASSITYKWVFGETMCKIQGVINSVFCEASILTLMFVSLERFIAILHPLKYRTLVTSSTVKILLGVIWFQAILCATSTFWFSKFRFLEFEHICTVDWSYRPAYTFAFSIIFFFLPFIVMTIFYVFILRAALKQRNKICDIKVGVIQHDGKNEKPKSHAKSLKEIQKENKATIMIAIVVGTFIVCWFPHAAGVYCLAIPNCNWKNSFFVVTTWLAMLNSALNSGIYGLLNTGFRRAFKSIILCGRHFGNNDVVTIAGEQSRRSQTK